MISPWTGTYIANSANRDQFQWIKCKAFITLGWWNEERVVTRTTQFHNKFYLCAPINVSNSNGRFFKHDLNIIESRCQSLVHICTYWANNEWFEKWKSVKEQKTFIKDGCWYSNNVILFSHKQALIRSLW